MSQLHVSGPFPSLYRAVNFHSPSTTRRGFENKRYFISEFRKGAGHGNQSTMEKMGLSMATRTTFLRELLKVLATGKLRYKA